MFHVLYDTLSRLCMNIACMANGCMGGQCCVKITVNTNNR